MIGKAKVPRWQYEFNCHHCQNVERLDDDELNWHGYYCMVTVLSGNTPIHADDDRVIRCDYFKAE